MVIPAWVRFLSSYELEKESFIFQFFKKIQRRLKVNILDKNDKNDAIRKQTTELDIKRKKYIAQNELE